MSIIIRNIKKIKECGFVRLESDVEIKDKKLQVWNETYSKWADGINDCSGDSILIALLPTAFENKEKIISEVPLSAELVFNINKRLIPALRFINPELSEVSVECSEWGEEQPPVKGVAASFSLGVDSYHTVQNYISSEIPGYKLTHLLCYEFDRFKSFPSSKNEINNVFRSASELNLPLIEVWSNIPTVLKSPGLFPSHTYWLISAVIMFSKFWGKYYISSSYPFDDISKDVLKEDCSHYETLLLNALSIRSMQFILDDVGMTRFDKTADLVKLPIARKTVVPCWKHSLSHNCGYCGKCVRTMVDLDAAGIIDEFSEAFDVGYYSKVRKYYLMCMCLNKDNVYFKNSYSVMLNKFPDFINSLNLEAEKTKAKFCNSPNWYLEAAATDGVPEAMINLSKLYVDQRKDWKCAADWCKKAFETDSKFAEEYAKVLLNSKNSDLFNSTLKLFESDDFVNNISFNSYSLIIHKLYNPNNEFVSRMILSRFELVPPPHIS